MKNRIDTKLLQLQTAGKKMLSPYITAGDPEPGLTVQLMHTLVKAGADLLEIGIPFSDPMAEGPVIQAAMERALKHGVHCDYVLDMVKTFRQNDQQTPIVLMGYVNSVEFYGYERFAQNASAAGVDGTILVDLPPEESGQVADIWQKHNLRSIYLCSPTTSDERMALINHYGNGYLYYVSLKGVTGSSDFDLENVKQQYSYRKSQTRLPLMVGFGIKTAETAAAVADFADGVIVGAGVINAIYDAWQAGSDCTEAAFSLINSMRQAIDNNG
ncbi:tryptophan synthase subunit alpha [Legionella dresdenensis]|uniref:Tryptophan synthase alpha chain n=1 Tax=Legionella dresdenensis TaxID=450200 RepID=A0ABV8CEB3_9GAMM